MFVFLLLRLSRVINLINLLTVKPAEDLLSCCVLTSVPSEHSADFILGGHKSAERVEALTQTFTFSHTDPAENVRSHWLSYLGAHNMRNTHTHRHTTGTWRSCILHPFDLSLLLTWGSLCSVAIFCRSRRDWFTLFSSCRAQSKASRPLPHSSLSGFWDTHK